MQSKNNNLVPVTFRQKLDPSKSPFLQSLNKKVIDGRIKDRIYGRTLQLERLQSTLIRRKKCNAILVGEAGTGKTSIVEELAYQIVEKTTHDNLLNCEIYELDVNGLLAGTQHRGEYETRIRKVLESLENETSSDNSVEKVLFIDEIHNIVGSDEDEVAPVLSNMLKPALARGQFKCIGSTTYDEYVKHIMPDGALSRRFQLISVEGLDLVDTFDAVMTVKGNFEKHHGCLYTDSAIRACIYIADKYIKYRQNPDKTIDLIDEIGSNFAMRKKEQNAYRKDEIDNTYVHDFCEQFLGIKIETARKDEHRKQKSIQRIIDLKQLLNRKIQGQEEAVSTLCRSLMRKECSLNDSKKPIASFMLAGPSATGKTKLARTLGESYFGFVLKLDMSEYIDKISTSTLIGSPPGYVGFHEGGTLTNFVSKNPQSLIIFDEIEKAHPSVITLLLQILEDGVLTDNSGLTHSFANTMILMTTNVANVGDQSSASMGFAIESEDPDAPRPPTIRNYFKPEFINRIDEIICLNRLSPQRLRDVARSTIEKTINQISIGRLREKK